MGKHAQARIFTRMRMHMHAQAQSGGSPRTSIAITILMGKYLHHGRAGISPLTFFSLCPVHQILPGDAGAGHRGNNNNNTMALPMGPMPSIAARGFH